METLTAEALMELLTPVLTELFNKVLDQMVASEDTIGTSEVVERLDNINENITLGTSEVVASINSLNESVTCINYVLALIVLLLIGGWLYSFFRDLFNQC